VLKVRRYSRQIITAVFLVIGVLLFYLAFRNINTYALQDEITTVKPIWLVLLLIPSWGGQFIRTWRWQLLLGAKGRKPKFWPTYHSLLSGYFVNLGIPRAGEISRCFALNSTAQIPVAKGLGTVVAERVVDLFFLFLVLFTALALQWEALQVFTIERIWIPLSEGLVAHKGLVLIGLISALIGFILFLAFFRRIRDFLKDRTKGISENLLEGLLSLGRLRVGELLLFIGLSLLIWVGYFFTTWFWFLALPSASQAGISVAFTVMVVGSIAKTLPIQGGGIGAYHFLVGELLVLYGLGEISSKTFALMNHGYQTVFYLIFGGFSMLWIMRKGVRNSKID